MQRMPLPSVFCATEVKCILSLLELQDKNHYVPLSYCQVIITYHVSNKLYRMVSCNTDPFVAQRMQEYHAISTVLKHGANRHINFKNYRWKLNYHLRPLLNQLFCRQRTCLWHWKPHLSALLRLKRERSWKILASNSQNSICWSWANIQKKKSRINWPRRWQAKMWPHIWICGYSLTTQ